MPDIPDGVHFLFEIRAPGLEPMRVATHDLHSDGKHYIGVPLDIEPMAGDRDVLLRGDLGMLARHVDEIAGAEVMIRVVSASAPDDVLEELPATFSPPRALDARDVIGYLRLT